MDNHAGCLHEILERLKEKQLHALGVLGSTIPYKFRKELLYPTNDDSDSLSCPLHLAGQIHAYKTAIMEIEKAIDKIDGAKFKVKAAYDLGDKVKGYDGEGWIDCITVYDGEVYYDFVDSKGEIHEFQSEASLTKIED